MTSSITSKTSMIIDGIAASEAIDSSGEILDVKGCDISDFENGVGLLNYEHRGEGASGASGNDIVGKIVYAKKIFKKDDCEDKRQEAYWDHVKLPYVYIKARLYDGADHEGAKALAAAIRDAVTHKEDILARFSIEGSTLKKEGQRLARTIARKVAVTFKPANKSAISGLVSDPKTTITQKQAEKNLFDSILDAETIKSEVPGHQKLGSYEMAYKSMEVETDPSMLLKQSAKIVRDLLKTMTGGGGEGAPSTRIGGDALAREDDRLHQFDKNKVKQNLRAAVRDLPDSARASKSEMLKFFKHRLPDVDPSFLDHFTDLIDDVRTRQVGDWVEKTMGVWGAVKKAEARGEEKAKAPKQEQTPPPVPTEVDYTPRPEAANPLKVPPQTKRGAGLSEAGTLLSSKLKAQKRRPQLYDYGSDPHFMEVLHADNPEKTPNLDPTRRAEIIKYVHTPWKRAAASWLILNKLAAAGQLPPSIIAHSAIFAAMSPNTSVPIQELYFGHYKDFTDKHGDIFLDPKGVDQKDAEHFHKWLNRNTPPEFFQQFYLGNTENRGGINFGREVVKKPGATLEGRPQGIPLLNYHRFHPLMTALVREVKDDGRAYVDYIMQHKQEHGAKSMMAGFGPKLARYQALLMGQGNVVVPDRHFLRALFNLKEGDPTADYIFNSLTPIKGETLLRGIDHHFNQKAPGVQKVVDMYPDHFQGRRMQANALGFWLQWLAMPHYNALRGIPTDNLNLGTAHDPYFKAVFDQLGKEGIPHDMADPSLLYKHDIPHQFGAPLPARVANATKFIQDNFGESAASHFFYAWGVPALLSHERMNAVDETLVRKMEALSIEFSTLAKAEGIKLPGQPTEQWPPAEAPTHVFRGHQVKPGFATVYATLKGEHVPDGRKMAILGKMPASEGSPQGDWLMVPHEKLETHGAHDVERWGVDGASEIHSEPTFSEAQPGVVHGELHVPPHYAVHDFQKGMVHGLDVSPTAYSPSPPTSFEPGIAADQSNWRILPNGKLGYVKGHYGESTVTGMPSTSHAEALYHNAMHHFGLGEYVAPTTLFQHPDIPIHQDVPPSAWSSVHEAIPNAEHFNNGTKHHDRLREMLKSGELDKLGLVNAIMGNRDRNVNNFMFSSEGKDLKLKLIDHAWTAPTHQNMPRAWMNTYHFPAYMRLAKGMKPDSHPLHPEAAKWLMSQDPKEFEKFLGQHQVPPTVAYSAVAKLKAMQDYVKQEPDASWEEVFHYPAALHGRDAEAPHGGWYKAAISRARKIPDEAARLQATNQIEQMAVQHDQRRKEVSQKDFGADRLHWDVADIYQKAMRNGEDPAPYTLLVQKVGDEEAKKYLAPLSGPHNESEAIRKFNHQIRSHANRQVGPKLQEAQQLANTVVALERGNHLAGGSGNFLAPYIGRNLDDLANNIHGPVRGDLDDEKYRERLMQYLAPFMTKARGMRP